MIKIGDTVKVIGMTNCGGLEKECIPIGTICTVVNTNVEENGTMIFELVPKNVIICYGFWYLEKDIEKGHLEWVKD